MDNVQRESVRGVLNETSMTIHKHEMGAADFQTACGQIYDVEHGQLRLIQITEGTDAFDADRCSRCFEDGQ